MTLVWACADTPRVIMNIGKNFASFTINLLCVTTTHPTSCLLIGWFEPRHWVGPYLEARLKDQQFASSITVYRLEYYPVREIFLINGKPEISGSGRGLKTGLSSSSLGVASGGIG